MGLLPFEKMHRQLLVRKDAETNPKYGCNPLSRPIAELLQHSIVIIDKPAGPTSHQVSAYVKRILNLEKAGHSGTLDPQVTGVLPVALGSATRIVQSLLTSGKEYICVMHVHADKDEAAVRAALDHFTGKIKQLPPVKSAIKREWRFRKVYYSEFLEQHGRDVLFVTGTQAGTYIRKLCHDIGEYLGCGAHMAELRRTKAGPFGEKDLATLQDLTDALHYYKEEGREEMLRRILHPIEDGAYHLGKIYVLDSTVDALCHGMQLKVPGIAKVETEIQKDDSVAVMSLKGELILVGVSLLTSKEHQTVERGLAVKTEQVFMKIGVYPRTDAQS